MVLATPNQGETKNGKNGRGVGGDKKVPKGNLDAKIAETRVEGKKVQGGEGKTKHKS